jgi:hypothetical protein
LRHRDIIGTCNNFFGKLAAYRNCIFINQMKSFVLAIGLGLLSGVLPAQERDMPYSQGNFRSELNFLASGCAAMSKEVESASYTEGGLRAFFQQLDACLNQSASAELSL